MKFNQKFLRLIQGDSLRAQLLRGGMGSVTIKIINTLLSFLLAVLLARALGPRGNGVYAFTLSILMLLSIPIQAGLPTLVVRETAKAHANNDWPFIRGIWRWVVRLICIFSSIVLVIIGGVLWVGYDWIDPARRVTFFAGLMLVPLTALVVTQGGAIRGLGKVSLGQFPHNVLRPGLFIIFLLATPWLVPSIALTPQQAMQLHLLSTAIAVIFSALALRRLQPVGQQGMNVIRQEPVAWRCAVFPLTLVAGFQLINSYADIVMLGLMRSDEEVGVYRVVVQMGNLVVFGLFAVNQVLHPHLAKLHDSGDKERLQRLVTVSARVILVFATPPVLLFVFAGAPVLKLLFGEEYMVGAHALGILAIGQLANAAFGSVGALLNMTGHEKDTVRGLVIAAIVNIALNILLIPKFGMAGAASATAMSYVVWNAVLRSYVRRRLDIESLGWGLRKKS
ncbi:MAG: flippase [Desulfocapsaceae bacterium]|nr:flippase [Desulfocapsaceae bacterium]